MITYFKVVVVLVVLVVLVVVAPNLVNDSLIGFQFPEMFLLVWKLTVALAVIHITQQRDHMGDIIMWGLGSHHTYIYMYRKSLFVLHITQVRLFYISHKSVSFSSYTSLFVLHIQQVCLFYISQKSVCFTSHTSQFVLHITQVSLFYIITQVSFFKYPTILFSLHVMQVCLFYVSHESVRNWRVSCKNHSLMNTLYVSSMLVKHMTLLLCLYYSVEF